jgi:hypothetical protein
VAERHSFSTSNRKATDVRRLIYVAGMHRSGTSATTRVINLLGASLGEQEAFIPEAADNPRGFWEVRDVAELNDLILADIGASWDQPPASTEGALEGLPSVREESARAIIETLEADGAARHAIKDPRFSFLLPFWERFAPAAHLVVPVRHPLAVAQSLRRRNDIPLTQGLALWERYTTAAIALQDRPVIVDYNNLLTDTDDTVRLLQRSLDLPEASDEAMAEIADFLAPELDHLEDELLDTPELERALDLHDRLKVRQTNSR